MTEQHVVKKKKIFQRFINSPPRLIVSSFIIAIFIGWILLMMPFAAADKHLSPIDALFTATSGVCVTGLTVIDVEHQLSFWGQLILLVCIQLGGLGIMTFSTLFLFILRRSKLSFAGREALHQTLTPMGTLNIQQLLFGIFKITILIEFLGAVILFISWNYGAETGTAMTAWNAIFHSISSFCNAGFSTFSENLYRYRDNTVGVITIAGLIIVGGLGFVVLEEIFFRRLRFLHPTPSTDYRPFLSLQTRIVLLASLFLIASGALFFFVFDIHTSLAGDSLPEKILHSFFQSITARTAGFNTVDIGNVTNIGLLLLMGLMFIGGAPGSAAGGIKLTTAVVIVMTIISHIRNRPDVELFHRRLPESTVSRSFIILVMGIGMVILFFGMLSIVNVPMLETQTSQDPALRLLFETVSAFGTVGLSTGITPYFHVPGKILIIILMLIGRLGPLTISVALIEQSERLRYRYPKSDVMVG